jgi:hypothetical protein
MAKQHAHDIQALERQEVAAVMAALERAPKLANLMHYLAEKYFAGEVEQLTEYNIATEVFERKKTSFVASEDAVARVETWRLRKRLKAYYSAEGKDHEIQIALPLGKYAPVFTRREADGKLPHSSTDELQAEEHAQFAAPAADAPGGQMPPSVLSSDSEIPGGRSRRSRVWLYAGALAALVCGLALCYTLWSRWSVVTEKNSTAAADPQRIPSAKPNLFAATVPFRIIAGYSGPPQRDAAGETWQSDQYFRNGSSWQQPHAYIDRTSDPLIFRFGRQGNVDYDIPLNPGTYELHLYTAEITTVLELEDAMSKRAFNIVLNGKIAIGALDPVSDAGGINVADERIVRDVSPDHDGVLHLHLGTVMGVPFLSALEIVPGLPGKQLPIRITTQPTTWADHSGQVWHPDTYFSGGRRLSHNLKGTFDIDSELYATERYGHFSYAIPVDSRDRYTVILHFAELYFGNENLHQTGPGKRVFRVICNGNTLLDNFDIFQEVGPGKALVKKFFHLKPTAQGKLNLEFEPIENYATVSAIEVLDEAGK